MCSATTSWLFATREIKHSTEKPEGQDQDATAENILFATLPKSTAMFALEGRGLSLLWRLSECWYALRSGLHHTSAFLHATPTPFLTPAPQNCPFPETRLQWAVAALPSQPREVLNEWYLLKQSVDAQPQGPSSLSRDKPLWFRSRWCWGRFILHRAFKSMLVQCKQSYPLWSHLQWISSFRPNLPRSVNTQNHIGFERIPLGSFPWETTWACTAQKQSQDTLSCHRDKSVHSSHHIVLPPSSGHPSGRKSSYITMGVCPA